MWENPEYRDNMCNAHRLYNKVDSDIVNNLYKNGLSIKKIAIKLNTNAWQVKKSLTIKRRLSGFSKGHLLNIGKECKKETKEKIRDAQINKKRKSLTKEHKEKIRVSNIGKTWSEDAKLKVSGIHSHLWKGGLTSKNITERSRRKYFNWRKSVMDRDDYICKVTGERGGKLEVHHILNFAQYNEFKYKMENGETMKETMHKKFHEIYGKKDNTLEQLEEFKEDYRGGLYGTF